MESKVTIRLENELEQLFGIFKVPDTTKPEECKIQKKCFCTEFKFMDEEGLCPQGCFEKRLRSEELRKKMIAKDERREDEIKKLEEKEKKYYETKGKKKKSDIEE